MPPPATVLTGLSLSLTAALFVAGCGSSSSSTVTNGATASGPAGSDRVDIVNYSFMPPSATVKLGTTVTWTNKDQFDHSVVGNDGGFAGAPIHTNASFTHTYAKAGTYAYHCGIHNYMTARVIVNP